MAQISLLFWLSEPEDVDEIRKAEARCMEETGEEGYSFFQEGPLTGIEIDPPNVLFRVGYATIALKISELLKLNNEVIKTLERQVK